MKSTVTLAATTGPLIIDVLGVNVSVILVRVMLMTKDFRADNKTFWYYNVSLTILMVVITFAIIADRQLGPGQAVMVGTGIGASGMVLVDILKERAEAILKAIIGEKK